MEFFHNANKPVPVIPQSNDIALLGAGQISLGIPESAILSLCPVAKVTKSLLVGIKKKILDIFAE
ncbi:MAG: hypothetical protein A2096_01415 [Spirochaetes bacterium GWF1_41_5]|nr:MAG: hypothetical protein A2096_01415 [Spirochaetes bacterium GWF1_41_5]